MFQSALSGVRAMVLYSHSCRSANIRLPQLPRRRGAVSLKSSFNPHPTSRSDVGIESCFISIEGWRQDTIPCSIAYSNGHCNKVALCPPDAYSASGMRYFTTIFPILFYDQAFLPPAQRHLLAV